MGVIIFDNPLPITRAVRDWFADYEFELELPYPYPAGGSQNIALVSTSSGAALLELYNSVGSIAAVSGVVSAINSLFVI